MKLKRILAIVLCFAMVLSTMSFTVSAEETTVGSTDEFQAALDAAVEGTVIRLQSGVNYGTVKIQPVAGNDNTTVITEDDGDGYNVYRTEYIREVNGLTIIGAEGATVDGIEVVTGNQNGIWCYADIKDLTIDSVTFSANTPDYAAHTCDSPIFISLESARMDGLTVTNCVMDGQNGGQNFVYIYGKQASGSTFETYSKNVTITNNRVSNVERLCELRETENVTIANNAISNTAQHAILLSCNSGNVYSGEIEISHNTADTIADRFVRMAGAGEANVTIEGNAVTNYIGNSSDFVKVSDCASEETVTIADNTLEGEATTFEYVDGTYQAVVESAPASTVVAKVGDEEFTDIQEAIQYAAPAGVVDIQADITVDEWIMISESLTIGNGNLITLVIEGMTINGNGHTLTINSIESAGNGGYLFFDASELNVNELTIKYADGLVGGIGLKDGTLSNVTFDSGVYGVMPQTGDVEIKDCNFKTNGTSIYFEEERDGLVVSGCTFENADDANVILLRGDIEFTNNTIISGRTVNVVSGSPVVTGNDFGDVRFKVYNEATATIDDNEINVLAFNDESAVVNSTFGENTLSDEAQTVLDAVNNIVPDVPTGSNSLAYTKEVDGYVRVWGQSENTNAAESYVLKLYSGDILIATTSLNNVGNIIDGSQDSITWNFFYPESTDEYWTTTWEEGHPDADGQPTKVELYIDGTLVSTTDAQMNGPDGINPVVWAELGGVAPAEPEVIEIYDWEDLKELDARVESGDMLEGVTVKLMNDIDLYEMGTDGEPVSFNPIGANSSYFKGTFDGQGYAIKNMYQSGWALGYDWDNYGTIGLFAYLWDATVKNLTIENAECFVEGGNVAAIAGCAWGECTFENITVKNSTFATYNNRAAGIIGYTGGEGTMTFKDITVDGDTVIAGLWGSFDSTLGGVVGSTQSPTKFHFEDVTVECKLDCYNDVTASYKWYSYRMCGMLIGRMTTLQAGTTDVDPRGVVTLDNVNITIGEWANQTYIWDDSLSRGCQRVEPGYQYGGVNVENYPDAEVTSLSFNTIIGGPQSQSQGYYGSDITKLEALEGFDTSTTEVTDLAEIARNHYVAAIGENQYETLEAALAAATEGCTITLLSDITVSELWDCRFNGAKVTVPVTIDGNGKTLTLTGAVDDKNWNTVFRFEKDATVKNLTIDASEATGIQRFIAAKLNVTVENCTFIGNGTTSRYGVIYGEGAQNAIADVEVSVTNSTFQDCTYGVADNRNGQDAKTVTVTGNVFSGANVLISASEAVTFTGNTITGGYANITSYTAADTAEVMATGNTLVGTDDVITVNPENITADDAFSKPVAKIASKYYETVSKAIKKAKTGETVVLLTDVSLSDTIIIPAGKALTLDLAGKALKYDSTVMGEAMITNSGNLTINDSVGSGSIHYNYTGAADASYGKGNYTISNAGTLTVNGGKISIANIRSHAKYPIDNNSTTGDAILVINGGHLYNYNTSAIRQFCNSTTYKNSVTVNGGLVEGYCAIWIQNPGANTVNGSLSITGGEIRTTASAWVNGSAEIKDVSSAIYCTIAGTGGAWDTDSAVSITGGTINENVYLAEDAPEALTVDGNAVFNGYVELPAPILFKVAGTTASLDSSLALNIYVETLDEVTAGGYYAVIEHTKATGEVVTTQIPYTDWISGKAYKAIRYTGIAAKEMADTIKLTIYAADGTPVSEAFETSLRAYAISTMRNAGTGSLWIPALMDMLNYGAAAQTMFSYNTDDPAYVGAEAFHSNASSEYTLDKAGCTLPETLIAGTTLTLEEAIQLNFYLNNAQEGMKAEYAYTTHTGEEVTGTVEYDAFISGYGYRGVPVDIAIADADALVTVTLFDSAGTELGKATYSADAYLKDMIDKGHKDSLYPALAKFADSAKKAFGGTK